MGWSPFRKTGLTHNSGAALKGYTIVSPLMGDATYLIDMPGQVTHRWRFPGFQLIYSRLLPDGNLLTLAGHESARPPSLAPGQVPTFDQHVRMVGGVATHLLESDWDGNVVWQYENWRIHHDFVRLDNGNTLLPEVAEVPEDVARQVRGGVRSRRPEASMIADNVLEIDAKGKELRRWHLWELFDPRRDPICPLDRRESWTHLNSLDVMSDGGILISCRHNSRVGIIDREKNELRWKFGAPEIHHQHHATALLNGNVQIFDNGMHRQGTPQSAVVEVDPRTNEIVWRYEGSPPNSFFSGHISGAERLEGGHVLIAEGASGRVFEVTSKGEVVWEWISPFHVARGNGQINWVFRSYRYGLDHPALAGRELNPERYRELNRAYGLSV